MSGARRPGVALLVTVALVVAIAQVAAARATPPRHAKLPVSAVAAWVRASLPGATDAAAYMTLRNSSAKPVILASAHTSVAAAVEFHVTVRTGDRAEMRPMGRVPLPARGSVTFQPGGAHVMLIGIRHPLLPGTKVPMTLVLAGGDSLVLGLEVRGAMEAGAARRR